MSNVNFDHIMRSVAGASQRVCQPAQHVRSGAKAAKVAAEKTMEDRKKNHLSINYLASHGFESKMSHPKKSTQN